MYDAWQTMYNAWQIFIDNILVRCISRILYIYYIYIYSYIILYIIMPSYIHVMIDVPVPYVDYSNNIKVYYHGDQVMCVLTYNSLN